MAAAYSFADRLSDEAGVRFAAATRDEASAIRI
jgi:hypothetical protein